MAEFLDRYGSEDKRRAALVAMRWPNGFVCPDCGCARHCSFVREGRQYWQCNACRTQFSVTCGTVFQATKLPLTRWFLAMHLMTQAKNVSALELKRSIGRINRPARPGSACPAQSKAKKGGRADPRVQPRSPKSRPPPPLPLPTRLAVTAIRTVSPLARSRSPAEASSRPQQEGNAGLDRPDRGEPLSRPAAQAVPGTAAAGRPALQPLSLRIFTIRTGSSMQAMMRIAPPQAEQV